MFNLKRDMSEYWRLLPLTLSRNTFQASHVWGILRTSIDSEK